MRWRSYPSALPHAFHVSRVVCHYEPLKQHFTMKTPEFDIVICGGGMVGAAVAALIHNEASLRDLRVALIEAKFPNQAPTDEVDIRVSAVSRASQRILTRAGAWQRLTA